MTIENRRTDGPPGEAESLIDTLQDLIDRGDLEDRELLIFGVEADSRREAGEKARGEMARLLDADPSSVRIIGIHRDMVRAGGDDMECTGPVSRYETVCWAPGTRFKGSRVFDTEPEAMEGMNEFLNAYKSASEAGIPMPNGQRLNLPSPEDTGFKCALNEKVTKKLCDLTPGQRHGRTIGWEITAENPTL